MTNLNILRVSSYPSKKNKSVGLHSYYLGRNEFKTIYLTYKYPTELLKPLGNSEIFQSRFDLHSRKSKNIFFYLFYSLRRIFYIFSFSISGILILFKHPKINFIHIHSPMYILIVLAGKILNKKCFITFHGEDTYIVNKYFFNKIFYKLFDYIFTLDSLSVSKFNYNKIQIVKNGINKKNFFRTNEKKKKIILSVASFKKQKNHEFLIKEFKKFIEKGYNYKLYLVGDGYLKSYIEKLVLDLDLSENVFFFGQLDHNKLNYLYNISEIFVLPSEIEGFPKVLLEAMSCDCKLLVSKVGANQDILGNNYNYYHNKLNFLKKLILILRHQVNKNKYKKILENYSWDNIHKEYLEIYKKFL